MWYPTTLDAPAAEPVLLETAKDQLSVEQSEDSFNDRIERLIAAARAHVENYCGARFASRAAVLKCDAFADLARLPEAPCTAVASIAYIDTAGATQTLASSVYELRDDGVEPSVVLKYGQNWPATQPGSRITVTATVGYATAPADVAHAMHLLISTWFDKRDAEDAAAAGTTFAPAAVDSLLANHRRGA